jgi:hypothetical protein
VQGFAKLCYTLVQTGSIKMTATLDPTGEKLLFPSLSLALDLNRHVLNQIQSLVIFFSLKNEPEHLFFSN